MRLNFSAHELLALHDLLQAHFDRGTKPASVPHLQRVHEGIRKHITEALEGSSLKGDFHEWFLEQQKLIVELTQQQSDTKSSKQGS